MKNIDSKVIILEETTRNPITKIGERAGICWGADISDPEKNYQRGLDCLENDHGRVLEFVNIEALISGWSSRVIREWYTHIGCLPTRLQASTRYINYSNRFNYLIPKSIKHNEEALGVYVGTMSLIKKAAESLEIEYGIPREDVANLFPLGMETVIVDKRNLRNAIDMSKQRLCKRAYWEFRDLMKKYIDELSKIDDEWKYIADNYFRPKCDIYGYCVEKRSCGRHPKKQGGNKR